ncbi:MAG: 5'-3' exonuclease H3TH domain-containing protein, partial [Muribaculaceae bacterium]|nr:5'-3' exonuclease H3TH domain-containing protein [Muribaculaceae bacterium]
MEEKKLFLLDAYALIFRAYYALLRAPRFTANGLNTSAIFGFVNTLQEILKKENPSHIAVCFDPPGPTFRHEAYEGYKAERDETPEDIKLSVPYIKDIIRAYNIPIIEVPGYEADDVIGTLATLAEKRGFTTYMMTPDKDFCQLVTDKIKVYRPAYKGGEFEIRGVAEVLARYGLQNTSQVIDLLALMGDQADNIPGCRGVGEKTAVKLIAEFGSVENLLENTDKLKGSLHDKVVNDAENIRFSKFLATIKTDVPVEFDEEALRRSEINTDALKRIFEQLEFRTLLARLIPKSQPIAA